MFFGHFLLEEGVELELKADPEAVINLLDGEVPNFTFDGCAYHINSIKGIQGSHWKFLVKAWDVGSTTELASTVGLIEMDTSGTGATTVKIPARNKLADILNGDIDEEGQIFSSFVFQLLNAFQGRGLIELPGKLPVR